MSGTGAQRRKAGAGRVLATCLLLAGWTAPSAAAEPTGNATAGGRLFAQRCQRCHTVEALAGKGDRVRQDLRRINGQMEVVGLLWSQEVDDLRAYLNSVAPPPANGPGQREGYRQPGGG